MVPSERGLEGEVTPGVLRRAARTEEVAQRREGQRPAGGAPHQELLDEAEIATAAAPERDRCGQVVEAGLVERHQHLDPRMGAARDPAGTRSASARR